MHSDNIIVVIGLAALCAAFFFALGYFIRKQLARGKLKDAEYLWERTLEINPDYKDARRNLEVLKARQ